AIPLSLRHFPRPYSRFKRRRSRTVVPDAIDSTLRISERSSNRTTKSLTQQPRRGARRGAYRFRHPGQFTSRSEGGQPGVLPITATWSCFPLTGRDPVPTFSSIQRHYGATIILI